MAGATGPNNATAVPKAAKKRRWLVFLSLAATIVILSLLLRDFLNLEYLAQQESRLRAVQQSHPVLVYGASLIFYVVVTGLSVPGATVLTLTYAWYFGFLPAVILVSFASTAGATLAFLLSRYLFRDAWLRRFGNRQQAFTEALKREGPFFLFTLRLIPAVPFFVINAVMGLTSMRVATFWWVSQLGMLPVTVVYVYAGASVPSLRTLADDGLKAVLTPVQLTQILTALALVGLSPWLLRFLARRVFVSVHRDPPSR